MTTALTGHCQCGAIGYQLTAEPLFTYACHYGSSDKGVTNTRYSCADCGNIIYGIGESTAAFAKLQAGTLDDTSAVQPEVHIWTQNKQHWLILPERVPQFETQPTELSALLQPALDYRAGG